MDQAIVGDEDMEPSEEISDSVIDLKDDEQAPNNIVKDSAKGEEGENKNKEEPEQKPNYFIRVPIGILIAILFYYGLYLVIVGYNSNTTNDKGNCIFLKYSVKF